MPRNIEVFTNSLQVETLPTAIFTQYEAITPLSNNPGPQSRRKNDEVINRLQIDNASVFSTRALYDGAKLMYSMRDISATQTFNVCMARRRTEPSHRVTIQRVGIVNTDRVRELLERQDPNVPRDPNVSALACLQLLVRQAPNMRHGFPTHSRAFLVSQGSKNLGRGLRIQFGFSQSVRPALGRLLINIDRACAPVLERHDENKLRTFLKGIFVKITCCPNVRPRPIADIVLQAGRQEFDKDGERIEVAKHFENKYNLRLRFPHCAGVRLGRTAIIPGELCEVVSGQVFKRRLPSELQTEFLRHATQSPKDRLRDIQRAIDGGLFNYTDSDFMRAAGMRVNPHLLSVTGTVLDPPRIVYRGGPEALREEGKWNVMRKQFFAPPDAPLRAWGVAIFDRETDEDKVKEFIVQLIRNLQALGMQVPQRPFVRSGNAADPKRTLEEMGQQICQTCGVHRPQLILVFLPANAAECKRQVKFWGTHKERGGKWGNSDQYRNNVALKINARLGGVNSVIDSPVNDILASSMVIGADVGHPGPGVDNRPSVTGLVASVDPRITKFTSFAHVQQPRLEAIQDLREMMVNAFKDYLLYRQKMMGDHSGRAPTYLIFYRDGVSEGEFARVSREEIKEIKNACVQMDWRDRNTQPKLLFVVVGKRHHIRFFPKGHGSEGTKGNCPAGLTVHNQITHPDYNDFYLLSHAGLLGTSRPGHYTVLSNEANFPDATIHNLSYHLCHMYAPATRSVSIPAPVYYADKLCGRLEFHCENLQSMSDTASSVASNEGPFDLEEWKRTYTFQTSRLHQKMGFL
ncbi:Piwi domain-containing protein [Daedaleopsis nitida]|nr:Piwi domain-containing protein [Daedaleopsis nitida]